jgi:hypothetical protein
MTIPLNANELVVKAGDSIHIIDNLKVKGKLILTNQRLFFKFLEEEKHIDFEILPKNIKEIFYFNSMKIIPNGLTVITRDGIQLRFLVKERNSWGQMINKMY